MLSISDLIRGFSVHRKKTTFTFNGAHPDSSVFNLSFSRVLVYLRPRGASNLALEKCVAALREARIPENLLENGRRGAFHLYSHLNKNKVFKVIVYNWLYFALSFLSDCLWFF